MQLTLTIRMDNEAFQDTGEVPRILRGLADYLETTVQAASMDDGLRLMDSNGNAVGEWMIVEEQ